MPGGLRDEALAALNWLAGCDFDAGGTIAEGMPARGAAAARAEGLLQRMQPAPGDEPAPLPRDAFHELLQGRAVHEFEPTSRALAPYRRDAASPPETVAGCRFFSDLSDARWQFTDGEGRRMLQSADDRQRMMHENPVKPRVDPGLGRSRRRYSDIVVSLQQRGLLRTGRSCVEETGVFFTRKKGRENMCVILDCRRGNQWFKKAPHAGLLTAEGLAGIEAVDCYTSGCCSRLLCHTAI